MSRLAGKVAIISGAGVGIGRSAAVLFAEQGAKVAIAEIDSEAGAETERLAREAGGEALFVETDVTKTDSVMAAIEATVSAFGKLDVVYNNAGGSTSNDARVTDAPEEEFWRVISLDLFGTFLMCKHGIPQLIEAGGGSVINTASNVALMALPGRDCYTAAKGGVAAMTRSMAAEYASDKVRVNAIAPCAIRTDRVAHMMDNDPDIKSILDRHLLGVGEPIDIAQMALYLASDEARITTGQVLPVDSGITIS